MLSIEQVTTVYKYILIGEKNQDRKVEVLTAIPTKCDFASEEDINIIYNLVYKLSEDVKTIMYLETFREIYLFKKNTNSYDSLVPLSVDKTSINVLRMDDLYSRYRNIKENGVIRDTDGLNAYRILIDIIIKSNVLEERLPVEEINSIFTMTSLPVGVLNSNYIIVNDGYGDVKLKMSYSFGSLYLLVYDEECGVIGCLDSKNIAYEVELEDVIGVCVNSNIYRVKPDLYNAPTPTRVPKDENNPFLATANYSIDSLIIGKNIL